MADQNKRDPERVEYDKKKVELEEASGHAAAWNRRVEALLEIVKGYEKLFASRPTPKLPGQLAFEAVEEIEPTIEEHPASTEGEETNFRAAILEIIGEQKRGARFPKIKAEVEKRQLKTSGAKLDDAIRYAINGLKGQGKIRTPRRGVYKIAPPKFQSGTNGSMPLTLVANGGLH